MNLRTLLIPLLFSSVACGAAAPPPPPPPVTLPAIAPMVAATDALVAASREDDAAIPISPRNPTWGSRTALVTIVEFSDLQCPFCSRVVPTLAALREAYGPDNLRIVWKNNPLGFHPNARPAAEAAMGVFELAGTKGFWRFHDAAFDDQASLGAESYERWAREAGVTDLTAFRAGLAGHRWADAVDADVREADALGAHGTPTFFINGILVVGAQPLDVFKKTIDAELAKAASKVAAGTPRDRVYAELTQVNRESAPKPDDHGDPADEPPDETKTVFKVPVGSSPVRGGPAALVTIIEFGDYQCPFTARVQPTLDAIRKKFGDQVRIVWKDEPLPFHPNARPAAEAAREVRAERGDAAFWSMHDVLFEAQHDLSAGVLAKLAAEVGANPTRVRAAVSAHTREKEIGVDEDVADDFQASGTPHFFINGRRFVGAQPEEKFDAIIEQEIARARVLLTKGTPMAGLYDALVRDGKGPPAPEKKPLAALPASSPARGNLLARVTVHEWSDFQCPFCSRVEPTLAQVMKDYGTRIKLVWHDLPLPMHPDAPLAAAAGREAFQQKGSAGFWAIHDMMFSDQKRLKRDDLDLYARSLRIDMGRWTAALNNNQHQLEIDAEKKAADDMGIVGTPAFVVVPGGSQTGYFINGAQPYGKFRRIIERALSEAK
ncbi:MAG TPA: thioredoxin domain-containing protein [Polyangiaceae bacterium]|jgi:protein-disulfide isomerase